jgi:hypothetical protein
MKQTAVQLVYKLLKSGLPPEQVVNYLLIDEELVLEKEKEQIMYAWIEGGECGYLSQESDRVLAEQYYNETFNTNEK